MKTINSMLAAKAAILAGAAQGIGRAATETLAPDGASVAPVGVKIEANADLLLASKAAPFVTGPLLMSMVG
jgi:NAD(P)-dependent dehydrogenase (short-subunit alcohol dehydrogenase family)